VRLTTTHKIGLALLLPTAGAALALWLFYAYLAATAADSAFVNVAGRQRMLAQQILAQALSARDGHAEHRPLLHALLGEFGNTLKTLEQGGTIMGSDLPPAPAAIHPAIAAVEAQWGELEPLLRRLTGSVSHPHLSLSDKAVLEAGVQRLTDASHAVVSAYETHSRTLSSGMLRNLALIAAFDMVLFGLGVTAARRYLAERRRSEEALRQSEADWRLTFDSITDLVSLHDRDFHIVRANRALAEFVGVTPEALVGRHCYELFHDAQEPHANCPLMRTLASRRTETQEIDEPHLGCPLQITTSPVFGVNGEVIAAVHVAKDITAQRRAEQRLQQLAHYDHLTHLPNRTLFFDRLTQALVHAQRHRRVVAVLFLDLDRFKVINDTLGHDTGDRLLQAVAERLRTAVREGDTVARFGGDEFALALVDVAEEHDVLQVADKLLHELGRPFGLDGRELFVTTSIGISLSPHDGTDAKTLMRHADAAMYRAKKLGRNNYQRYCPSQDAVTPRRLTLETSLRHALDQQEFLLHYQPKIETASGRVCGVEALLRWQHPEMGLIAPLEFVPLLEETGLIVPVGAWILQTACAQAKAWQLAGLVPIRVAVNLSARQFRERRLLDSVTAALRQGNLDARWLELELTETMLMEQADTTLTSLHDLSAMGIQIAIDDFGTGYSSLSYLTRFPIDTLKIDRSFVRDLTRDSDDAAIIQAIIVMARSLGLTVVAEGVESGEQFEFLRRNRCDEIQGYYFSRPLSTESLTLWLRETQKPASGTFPRRVPPAA
jgi:diguanylate cyclase (GGDEF)-like protein/PAS domain S-box-containing protein